MDDLEEDNQLNRLDFSVIVCCYNSDIEKFKKTIISIIKQKDVLFELIIADDASTNGYLQYAIQWLDSSNIKYRLSVLNQNRGTVINALTAMHLAKAKYIKLISPGDYFFDEYSLGQYLNALKENNAKVVFSRAVYYTQEGKLLNLSNPINTKAYISSQKATKFVTKYVDNILGAALAYEKSNAIECLEAIKGKSRLTEDQPIVLQSALKGERIYPINQYLMWYEYGSGVSTQGGNAQCFSDDRNIEKFIRENYHSCYAKNILKARKILLIKNKFKRIIVVFFSYFPLFQYRISSKFHKCKLPSSIVFQDIKKITEL